MNSENNSGQTPMYIAAARGKLETVELLFKSGGKLNSRIYKGNTPLHVTTVNGHTKIVEFILANVVDKNPTS